jgi:hypothetical protein
MKVIAQARNVICVGVTEQKAVHKETALVVAFESAAEVFPDVRRIIVVIIRLAADIHVDEKSLTIVKNEQGHVSIGDGKASDRSHHG